MPGLSDFLSNPQRLQALSQFLLGFGQTTAAAGERGASTLGGLAAGFGGGGSLLQQSLQQQQIKELRDIQIKAAQAEEKRRQGTSDTFSRLNASRAVTGPNQGLDQGLGGATSLLDEGFISELGKSDPRLAVSLGATAASQAGADRRLDVTQAGADRRAAIAAAATAARTAESARRTDVRTAFTQSKIDERQQKNIEAQDRRLKAALKQKGESLPPQTRRSLIEQNQSIGRVLSQVPGVEEALGSVGLAGSAGELSTETLGQFSGAFGAFFSFPDLVRNRTRIRIAREELIKALAKSGSRVPFAEQKRIIGLLPSTGVYESERAAKEKISELVASLKRLQSENAGALGSSGVQRRIMIDAQGNIIQEVQ